MTVDKSVGGGGFRKNIQGGREEILAELTPSNTILNYQSKNQDENTLATHPSLVNLFYRRFSWRPFSALADALESLARHARVVAHLHVDWPLAHLGEVKRWVPMPVGKVTIRTHNHVTEQEIRRQNDHLSQLFRPLVWLCFEKGLNHK